jgi:hypothetical protein
MVDRYEAPRSLTGKSVLAEVYQVWPWRLVFGIGAGGSELPDPALAAMVHREYDAFGIDVVTPGEAQAALSETCTLVRKLWAEEQPFDFEGRCYRLEGAVCEPKPVQRPGPPVMIDAGARHLVLGPIGAPSMQWVADEIIRPVLSTAGSHG